MELPFGDATTLSTLYHLNSELWHNPEAMEAPYQVDYRRHAGPGEQVPLPASGDTPLRRLLLARRSCRSFTGAPLSLADLATWLHAGYGLTRQSAAPGQSLVLTRTVPSAGGLFPLELYLMLRGVEGVEEGLYHYDVLGHALEPLRPAAWSELQGPLPAYSFVEGANGVALLAGVFARTQKKYGPRGYRFVLLEAGHVAQNLCLAAAELGLGSLCLGGFLDTRLNGFLGLPAPREGVVYAVALGHAREEEGAGAGASPIGGRAF